VDLLPRLTVAADRGIALPLSISLNCKGRATRLYGYGKPKCASNLRCFCNQYARARVCARGCPTSQPVICLYYQAIGLFLRSADFGWIRKF
jgi:hypothetical protein